jgi:DUF1680 family protein
MKDSKQDFSRRKFIRNNGLTAAGIVLMQGIGPSAIGNILPSLGGDTHRDGGVKDMLFPNEDASINGFLGEKLMLSYKNRILAQDYERLIEPFRHRTETRLWQTEFWGKWFTSAVAAYRYHPTPELKTVLNHAVKGLVATQTPDGYIGNYASSSRLDQWDIWGMKYCMMGLIDYYELTHDKEVLLSSTKLADYLINTLNKQNKTVVQTGNFRGMASSSVLGVICQLYTATGNKKYLDFAQKIVDEWESPDGPKLISKSNINVAERFPRPHPDQWYSPLQGAKAYEMMSCYEGLLDLYRLTGKEAYKTAAENTWENIYNTEMNILGSGASMECWFGGKALQTERIRHYQETCVSVTWIRLSLNLFLLTGKAKYADEIERTYYNALLGSMYPEGYTWAKYTPLEGQRLHGSGQCGMKLNCCVANGPRGLFALPSVAVTPFKKGISVNFYSAGDFKVASPGGQKVDLALNTGYPATGDVNLSLKMQGPEEMIVRLRIPSWSTANELLINGETVQDVVPGTFVELKRMWKPGDKISLVLDMRGRVIFHGDRSKFAAVMRGPVVLAQDARFTGNQIINTMRPVLNKDGYINLSNEEAKNKDIWMQYSADFLPESYTEAGPEPVPITLINYSSAGYAKNNPTYRVWIPQLFDPRSSH